MIKWKQHWFLQYQQIGMYDIWGYVAVYSYNVFVTMCRCLPDARCEGGSPLDEARAGWPGTSTPYGDGRPQWVNQSLQHIRLLDNGDSLSGDEGLPSYTQGEASVVQRCVGLLGWPPGHATEPCADMYPCVWSGGALMHHVVRCECWPHAYGIAGAWIDTHDTCSSDRKSLKVTQQLAVMTLVKYEPDILQVTSVFMILKNSNYQNGKIALVTLSLGQCW